ncbi:MAG: hypothetical protein E7334_07420 [Clostridiales bacterium]|nr:hypothetical protein [Clostridiales bacterium]
MNCDYSKRNGYFYYRGVVEDPRYIPLRFTYDGNEYFGLDPKCFKLRHIKVTKGEDKESSLMTFSMKGALLIRVLITHYFTHGVTEFTFFFENRRKEMSAILENVCFDILFEADAPKLKGILGDHVNFYEPYEYDLKNEPVRFVSDTGRATHINFPYFDLEDQKRGHVLAIGWAGTWTAEFSYENGKVRYTAKSVNDLRLRLKPGEKIRTALFVLGEYKKENVFSRINYWRDWFVKHNLPKANAKGEDVKPFTASCFALDTGLPNSDGSISERHTTWKPTMDKILSENIRIDYRWFDAGWYCAPDGHSPDTDWWGTIGTWQLDPVKWPGRSFRESTDYARAHGMKTLMWFEPERVTDPENLEKNYGYNRDWAIVVEGHRGIANNIGNPDCLKWTTARIKKTLKENRVEMYREDNNFDSAALWKHLDALEGEERQGITECRFIMGHYKMWDEIIECTKSYGGCAFVDSCASGGGRNDLESLRRGIPLLRSDLDRRTTAIRLSMSTSFNQWIPFCGANTREKENEVGLFGKSDKYIWRASYLPCLNVDAQYVYDPDQNFDIMRFGIGEWEKVAPYLTKQFYPLTPWHHREDRSGFTAHMYFDPEKKTGVLLAFRQEDCEEAALTIKLPIEGDLVLTDEDTKQTLAKNADGTVTLFFPNKRCDRLIWVNTDCAGQL